MQIDFVSKMQNHFVFEHIMYRDTENLHFRGLPKEYFLGEPLFNC